MEGRARQELADVLRVSGRGFAQYLRHQILGGQIDGMTYCGDDSNGGARCVVGHCVRFLGFDHHGQFRSVTGLYETQHLEWLVGHIFPGETPTTNWASALLLDWIEAWLCGEGATATEEETPRVIHHIAAVATPASTQRPLSAAGSVPGGGDSTDTLARTRWPY